MSIWTDIIFLRLLFIQITIRLEAAKSINDCITYHTLTIDFISNSITFVQSSEYSQTMPNLLSFITGEKNEFLSLKHNLDH